MGGLAVGLLAGFLKIMLPFLFLLAGVGLADAVSVSVGSSLPEFLGGEHSRIAIVFLVVFVILQAIGAMVSSLMRVAMTAASAAASAAPNVALLNRSAGAAAGLIYVWMFLSVFLIALQQIPVTAISEAIGESSFAHWPIGWADRFVASIEISDG